jgi:TonB family protein
MVAIPNPDIVEEHESRRSTAMKFMTAFVASFSILLSLLGVVGAQAPPASPAPIVTIRLSKDQIATVKTAPGITTRLVFLEQVREIICGDLYDAASGRGSFVVQRGGKDVFLKPVASKGLSNMFVKIGQDDEAVYSFDLLIVPANQAYRIVNVLDSQNPPVSKVKAQKATQRIMPPVMPGLAVIDWRIAGSFTGLGSGAYILPVGIGMPEPPPPQKPSAALSQRSTRRVPIQGDPIRRVKATYPEFAKAAGMNGEVVVEIVVDENGKVIYAKPLSGPALLRQAAVNAALGWRYTPTRVDGAATQAVGTITFRFERFLDDRDGKVRASSVDENGRRP